MSATPDPSKMTRDEKIAHTEKLINWIAVTRVSHSWSKTINQGQRLTEELRHAQAELTDWLEEIIPADTEPQVCVWDREGDLWYLLSSGDYKTEGLYPRSIQVVNLDYGPLYLDPELTRPYTPPTEGENK